MARERIIVSVDPATNVLLEEMVTRQDFYDRLLIDSNVNYIISLVSRLYSLDDNNDELEMDFYCVDNLRPTDLFAWQVVDEKDNILYPQKSDQTDSYATISPWPQTPDMIREN